jgi:hypothetical protein
MASEQLDLWKFFEDAAFKIKDSLFKSTTWMLGIASGLAGYASKEGFGEGTGTKMVTHPRLVMIVAAVGLLLIGYAVAMILDHGRRINHAFGCAIAARKGATTPNEIMARSEAEIPKTLPPVCRHILMVLGVFGAGFVALFLFAVFA